MNLVLLNVPEMGLSTPLIKIKMDILVRMDSMVKISSTQKRALEKISGKPWNSWCPEAIEAYFAFTNKGKRTPLLDKVWRDHKSSDIFTEVEQNLWDLMQCHRFHPYTIETWKEDFNKGLLFPWEFLNQGYPDAFIQHALEVYREARGYIPIDEITGIKEFCERAKIKLA